MSDVPSADLWPMSLRSFDITLAEATHNLALDEVLLNAADEDSAAASLRFWTATDYFVVLGRSNRADSEVDLASCRTKGIPVYRRSSGGGTVVVGPGCLCYSLALPLTDELRQLGISGVTSRLMNRTAGGLRQLGLDIELRGISDLVLAGRKISGNAQRWQKNAFIHHGTFLFGFDLDLIGTLLRHPSREPEYRQSRSHGDFVSNLNCTRDELKRGLIDAWNGVPTECPSGYLESAAQLAESRSTMSDWHVLPGESQGKNRSS